MKNNINMQYITKTKCFNEKMKNDIKNRLDKLTNTLTEIKQSKEQREQILLLEDIIAIVELANDDVKYFLDKEEAIVLSAPQRIKTDTKK